MTPVFLSRTSKTDIVVFFFWVLYRDAVLVYIVRQSNPLMRRMMCGWGGVRISANHTSLKPSGKDLVVERGKAGRLARGRGSTGWVRLTSGVDAGFLLHHLVYAWCDVSVTWDAVCMISTWWKILVESLRTGKDGRWEILLRQHAWVSLKGVIKSISKPARVFACLTSGRWAVLASKYRLIDLTFFAGCFRFFNIT